ncbi:MAG: polysaccharide biosynthesis protein, partial [Candidatus Magnetoovum sp. WYHC-5]|nr:polysaccharide biosynthesis protein [Candidatus Magnetoovum sp. WYHC-5]
IKVLGNTSSIKKIIYKKNVEHVIIAIPSLSHKELKTLYDAIKNSGVKNIKIVPRIYDLSNTKIDIKSLESIKIEDLIGRQVVKLDYKGIENFLISSSVLITGACGSIGSEIVVQVCAYNPTKVILFDIDETAMHNIELRIKKKFPNIEGKIHFIIGDVKDIRRLDDVFMQHTPDRVFHASAYKHVPMMEYNPTEAIKVNLFGTYNVAQIAIKYGVKTFIMISTDKAVEPTSVMGASKRLAEETCRALNGSTEFISVRFGNVLGSRGSVLPLFMEQLKEGGPLTVTHKEMKRYFMTIPEAVSLVLQASVIGNGGEVMVLDMGKPIKIVNLAEELIKFHGFEPYEDIDIKFVGLRPGEKLFEELLTAEEGTVATKHEKLFIAKNNEHLSIEQLNVLLDDFKVALGENSIVANKKIRELLRKYVRHFDKGEKPPLT